MVRVSHSFSVDFDDPSLVSTAGLVPVMGLTEEAGLHELVADRVTVPGLAGANAAAKVPALVAGMVAGADSITDMGLLRHGGMGRLFTAGRAPTTLGTQMWWRRRPTHATGLTFGAPPVRGGLRQAPWVAVAGVAMVAVSLGVFFPLLGIGLAVFLLLDLALGAVTARRTTP